MLTTTKLSSNLMRWCGAALLLSGLLTVIGLLLHPDQEANPGVMLATSWDLIHTALLIGIILSLFGLVGLYARQAVEVGPLGLIGFGLAFTGNALFVAVMTIDAYIIPALMADPAGQNLLDPAGPLFKGPLGLIFMSAGIFFALGQLLTGIATMRANVLPCWAGLLLIGAVLLAFSPPLPHLVGMVGGMVMGGGYIWLGYALSFGSATSARLLKQVTA